MAMRKKASPTKRAPVVQETAASQDYPTLLTEVKARIQSAQYAALRAVNKELVGQYWDIGRLIVERQQSAGWGASVVERLSTDLRAAFPGVGGLSTQNLRYMRQLFRNTAPHQNSNHWLEKLVGRTTCSSSRAARTRRSASSTCA